MSFFYFLAGVFFASQLGRRRSSHRYAHPSAWRTQHTCDAYYLRSEQEKDICIDAQQFYDSPSCTHAVYTYQPNRNWTVFDQLTALCDAAERILREYSSRTWWSESSNWRLLPFFERCFTLIVHAMGEM